MTIYLYNIYIQIIFIYILQINGHKAIIYNGHKANFEKQYKTRSNQNSRSKQILKSEFLKCLYVQLSHQNQLVPNLTILLFCSFLLSNLGARVKVLQTDVSIQQALWYIVISFQTLQDLCFHCLFHSERLTGRN